MKERGFTYIVYAVAATVLIASVIGYGEYRYAAGRDKQKMIHFLALEKHQLDMKELKDAHKKQLDKVVTQYTSLAAAQASELRKALRANKVLQDWWDTLIDPTIADYAWMRPGSDGEVRRGPELSAANPAAGEAGTSN